MEGDKDFRTLRIGKDSPNLLHSQKPKATTDSPDNFIVLGGFC